MKKQVIVLGLSLFCFSIAFSQSGSKSQSSYNSAIGGRFGTGYDDLFSASYKRFLSGGPGAIELNLGLKPSYTYNYYYNGGNVSDGITMMNLSAAYEYHVPISAVPGLAWFVGGGLGFNWAFTTNDNYRGFGLNIFPTGGADYKFGNIPLDVSVDIRPRIRLASPSSYDYESFYFPDFGFSARFTID